MRKIPQAPIACRLINFQKRDVEISLRPLFTVGDLLQVCDNQRENRILAVRECADDAGAPPDLAVEPLDCVVCENSFVITSNK